MLTITDMFCGFGGSSTGAVQVPGVSVQTAMNHWDLAIDVHNANHPDADHLQADISVTDPRYVRKSEILWASPECTNHSVAKGVKRVSLQDDLFSADKPLTQDAAERSRATMWDVPRFAEHHKYQFIVTENVVDAAKWVLFPSWLHAMDALGYCHRIVWLNSMHAQLMGDPAPQSRDRMYVVFWRKGNKAPDLDRVVSPKAWCPSCERIIEARQTFKKTPEWGRYRAQYVYRCPDHGCRGQIVEPGWLPASSVIDWDLPAERVGDRKKPLSPKTIARIREGLRRYGGPLHLEAAGNTYDAADVKHPQHGTETGYIRAWRADEPLRTIHTTATKGIVTEGILVPVEGRDGKQPQSAADVLRTLTTRNETGLLVPSGGTWHENAYSVEEAMRTVTTRENHALVMLRGTNAPKMPNQPLDTIAASGNHHGLLDMSEYRLVMRNNTPRGDAGQMTTPAHEALRTLTASNPHSIMNGERTECREITDADIENCRFRMLEPSEYKKGMAFPADYAARGTKREQVRGWGNAVTPPVARDLITVGVETLN